MYATKNNKVCHSSLDSCRVMIPSAVDEFLGGLEANCGNGVASAG